MWSWLARRLGVVQMPAHDPAAKQALELRVAALEEHVDWLHGSLRKLRGRVTGGLRGDPDPEKGTEGEGGLTATRGNPQAIEILRKRGRM